MKKKTEIYQVAYSWVNRGDGIRCAWCDKLQIEIENPNKHIDNHVKEDEQSKCKHEYRQLKTKYWISNGGGEEIFNFYCIKCLEIKQNE
jgi:hypothetical protein